MLLQILGWTLWGAATTFYQCQFPVMEPIPHFLYHQQHYSEHLNICPLMVLCRKWLIGNIMWNEVVGSPDFIAPPWCFLV